MNSPITNFELGRMQHREYEAEASRYWGQTVTEDEKSTTRHKLALALSGAGMMIFSIVQVFVV